MSLSTVLNLVVIRMREWTEFDRERGRWGNQWWKEVKSAIHWSGSKKAGGGSLMIFWEEALGALRSLCSSLVDSKRKRTVPSQLLSMSIVDMNCFAHTYGWKQTPTNCRCVVPSRDTKKSCWMKMLCFRKPAHIEEDVSTDMSLVPLSYLDSFAGESCEFRRGSKGRT